MFSFFKKEKQPKKEKDHKDVAPNLIDKDINAKISFLGSSNTGKSALINRALNDKYYNQISATVGCCNHQKQFQINDFTINLIIWDIAYNLRECHHLFFNHIRGSDIILLIFSFDYEDSLEVVKNLVSDIRTHLKEIPKLFVVGCKNDLEEKEKVITTEQGKKVAEELNAFYFEVSAKTGANIKELFDKIQEEIIKIHYPNFKPINDGGNKELKQQNALLTDENKKLKEDVQKLEEKVKTYENYLSSLKEKSSDLTFFDQNDYEEESVIGEGATSSVKIVHKQEQYAKKELVLFDHKSMQRFLSECEILFKLRHPCIIRVYGFNFGDETHKPSMILSLEPESLEAAIKENELSNEQKNRITVELVLGMRYIHKHKFMHRDLKPLNILLSKNKHVRITDFGLAKEEDLETSQSKGVGTLRFMAPELFDEKNKNYTSKVDVYSFGIILIFIVTDEYPPFCLRDVIIGDVPQLPENMSNWVRKLIISCLSLDPEKRPTFADIFEIIKTNNFDLFSDSKDKELTPQQQSMKKHIETRIMKIVAFEYQHQ